MFGMMTSTNRIPANCHDAAFWSTGSDPRMICQIPADMNENIKGYRKYSIITGSEILRIPGTSKMLYGATNWVRPSATKLRTSRDIPPKTPGITRDLGLICIQYLCIQNKNPNGVPLGALGSTGEKDFFMQKDRVVSITYLLIGSTGIFQKHLGCLSPCR